MPVYRPNMNTVLNLRERPTEAIAHERWSTPPLTSQCPWKTGRSKFPPTALTTPLPSSAIYADQT
ncbi:uncharacterized protein FFFS_04390 [Fusarium fujikuroi]|nr:uncharacterized protein FFFS_04390 [Fusarium fujikuroi]